MLTVTGNDLLVGNAGDDKLYGNTGNDVLFGGTGIDQIDGGDGNDLLVSGSVDNENSSWTAMASVGNYSAATYSNPADNDAALILLLSQWGTSSNRGSIGSISHDGLNDDLIGGLGDEDFCWEVPDVFDNPPGLAPSDFNAFGMGTNKRFGPSA